MLETLRVRVIVLNRSDLIYLKCFHLEESQLTNV